MINVLLYIDLALVLLLVATLFVVAHLIREMQRLHAQTTNLASHIARLQEQTSPRYLDKTLGGYFNHREKAKTDAS